MSALIPLPDDTGKTAGYMWWCSGCGVNHPVWLNQGARTFDGNVESPTFSPSIFLGPAQLGEGKICHSFIKNGTVEYCSDCTHALAGKTVPLTKEPT